MLTVRNAEVIACRNEKQVGKPTSGEKELWLPYCMQLMQFVILFHHCLFFPELTLENI